MPQSPFQAEEAVLAVDLGTSSIRAALVDPKGQLACQTSRPVRTSFPQHGHVEQEPAIWWRLVCEVCSEIAEKSATKPRAVAVCGHMHAPVLVDAAGEPVMPTAMLWNDKRASGIAEDLGMRMRAGEPRLIDTNPPTAAWPGIKLLWLKEHRPDCLDAAWHMLMPKDFINLKLTGMCAMDWTEAGSSYLMNPETRDWSPDRIDYLGLDASLLPRVLEPWAQVGSVQDSVSAATGLAEGIPVFAGGGDFPVALLGTGFCRPNELIDITGTSYLLTKIREDWNFRSAFFDMFPEGDSVLVWGKGYGHGIGMSQEGAMKMTREGYDYQQIICFYFTDVEILSYDLLQFYVQEPTEY